MEEWPVTKLTLSRLPEERNTPSVLTLHTHVEEDFNLLSRYSTLSRSLRVAALCIRFAQRCRIRSISESFITPADIADAKVQLLKRIQFCAFQKQLSALRQGNKFLETSSIANLSPILNEKGLLCVGGHLDNTWTPAAEKHPPILPKLAHLSRLFVRYAHVLHGGLALTSSFLRKHIWIIHGRALTKFELRRCFTCRRHRAELGHQQIGQLSTACVTPSRQFSRSGVDFARPIRYRTSSGRGHKAHKAYFAIFVCLATKAVHIEVVSDLTTNAFLAAFCRFTSRQGVCSEMLSDNETKFVGTDVELQALLRSSSNVYKDVATTLANSGTLWRFIPLASPRFGGLWEAGVRSAKGLLKKTLGEQTLTFEELITVLAQVEACLNSRPLVPLSSDPSDLSVLTPAHFLVSTFLLRVPEPPLHEATRTFTSRWRLVQQLCQQFWRKWSTQYLNHLQQRTR